MVVGGMYSRRDEDADDDDEADDTGWSDMIEGGQRV
jgi:hypothetical protein